MNFFGVGSNEEMKTNLGIKKDLIMVTFPYRDCRVTVRDGSSLPVQTETLIFWFRFTPRSTSVLTRVGFTDAAFIPCYSNSTLCRLLLSLCVIAMWLIVGNIYTAVSRKVVQLKSIKAYATIPKSMMGCGCSLLHRQVHEFSARWKAVI